jgi:diguanylate cyclase (GGDEF)-like protein
MRPKQRRQAVGVLLVEDDEHLRQYIARLLASEGYRVEEAEDEGQALSAASRTDFGVVVTDLGLPGIGGVALIELLAERQKATTFVIVTGLLDEGLPSSPILDRTIVAVLTKPLDRDELCRVVERAFDIHETRQTGEQAFNGGVQPPKSVLVLEENPDDVELVKQYLSELYEPTPEILVAGRVQDAEELLGQVDIDLVLSDLRFADARGLDAVRRLQKVAPDRPLIVLTGLDDEALGNHAVQLGAQEYLIKGAFSLTSLKRVIRYSMERKQLESELTRLAQTDHLTGLSNRLAFRDRATHALARARRNGEATLAVLYMDLNGFKAINDRLGHEGGDAVLCEVADRLRRAIREVDLAARLGGDEFAVLLEGVGTEELALQAAHRIPEILEFPLKCARGMPVSFSIGMSLHPAHGDTVDELLATADCAMYRAKRARTGQISVASRKTEGPN